MQTYGDFWNDNQCVYKFTNLTDILRDEARTMQALCLFSSLSTLLT